MNRILCLGEKQSLKSKSNLSLNTNSTHAKANDYSWFAFMYFSVSILFFFLFTACESLKYSMFHFDIKSNNLWTLCHTLTDSQVSVWSSLIFFLFLDMPSVLFSNKFTIFMIKSNWLEVLSSSYHPKTMQNYILQHLLISHPKMLLFIFEKKISTFYLFLS